MRIYSIGASALLLALAAAPIATAGASSLRGSPTSMEKQYEAAKHDHVVFVRTPSDVRKQVATHQLLPIQPNEHLALADVSYPYARSAAKSFVERLAVEYYAATGEKLVVTSLTRPESRQPRNAHPLSVHPAGLAVDFRVPAQASQRAWLERTLLALEDRGVLDVTRELHPSHYHVAVYPEEYEKYAAALPAIERPVAQRDSAEARPTAEPPAVTSHVDWRWPLSVTSTMVLGLCLVAGTSALRRRQRLTTT